MRSGIGCNLTGTPDCCVELDTGSSLVLAVSGGGSGMSPGSGISCTGMSATGSADWACSTGSDDWACSVLVANFFLSDDDSTSSSCKNKRDLLVYKYLA